LAGGNQSGRIVRRQGCFSGADLVAAKDFVEQVMEKNELGRGEGESSWKKLWRAKSYRSLFSRMESATRR